MADGNRSAAEGKQVAVDDYDEHGGPHGGYGGAAGAVGWDGAATSGGSTGSYYWGASNGDWRGGGYGGMGFLLPENSVGGGGGGGGSTLFPSTHIDACMYTPQHHPGPLYWPAGNGVVGSASFPSLFTSASASGSHHAGTGYWPDSNGGAADGSASFPSPFTGAGTHGPQHAAGSGNWSGGNNGGDGSAPFSSPFTAGASVVGPEDAPTGNIWHTGAADVHDQFYYRGDGNGSGGASATFPPPHNMGDHGMYYAVPYHAPNGGQPCSSSPLHSYMAQLDSDISRSLTSLSLRDRGSSRESLVAHGRRHLSNLVNHGRHQEPLQQLINGAGDLRNAPLFFPGPGGRGHGGDDPYAGKSLEDVRGAMSGVARDLAGCQFLVRMVAEGGAAAAGQVFEELAGGIVRLMSDSVAHELVEKLAEYWTDEQTTRVLHVLAASPNQIVAAVARNHAGSNILQTLVGRMAGNPGHAELFTSTIAGVGEHGVVSLMEHSDGSRLIVRCLDTFSMYQNRFITDVVARSFFLRRLCRDKHGCTVVNRCIDKAAAGDDVHAQLLRSIAVAVCNDGIALAEHGYGNFVVQQVMRSVPEARDWLHGLFRGWYVSLSRQKPSSHVVQGCLEHFSPEQADEIVRELLGCSRWDCTFRHLITDPYANYVLQSAMKRREIQMHIPLMDAISMHRNSLRDDRFAREVFREMREVVAGIDT